jgi:TadE-like protein
MITGSSRVEHDRRFKISRPHARGQSLVEFALVLPILLILFGGAVQFGVFFAAQNSLTQIARDTARWAATQAYAPCSKAADSPSQLLARADEIATASALLGFTSGDWGIRGHFTNPSSLDASPPGEGVEVVWSSEPGGACPPLDNVLAAYVTIRVTHDVPVVLPGFQYLPSIGTCNPDCHLRLTSTSTFRMEPPRQAPSP